MPAFGAVLPCRLILHAGECKKKPAYTKAAGWNIIDDGYKSVTIAKKILFYFFMMRNTCLSSPLITSAKYTPGASFDKSRVAV